MTRQTKQKKEAAPAPVPDDPKKVAYQQKEGETVHEALARSGIEPSVVALTAIGGYQVTVPKEHLHFSALQTALDQQSAAVQAGDFSRPEAMLTVHAHTLDAVFHNLLIRAQRSMDAGQNAAAETFMRMALKAQSQCRTSIEALAEIKFPKSATFIRQTNIAQQQQVNNGATPAAGSTARPQEKNVTPTNELLEATHGERLDTGTTSKAGGSNPQLETVGAVKRAQK